MLGQYKTVQTDFKGNQIIIYQAGNVFSDAGHAFKNTRQYFQVGLNAVKVAKEIANEYGVYFDTKTKTFYYNQQGEDEYDVIDLLVDAYLTFEARMINQTLVS